MTNRRRGPKFRYAHIVETISDTELYTPADIANHGAAAGAFSRDEHGDVLPTADVERLQGNCRVALYMLIRDVPPDGIRPYGAHSFRPAWFGSTWKGRLGLT